MKGDNGVGDNWGTQKVVTDLSLTGDGTSVNSLKIASQNATIGQVLKWNGTSWKPSIDENGTTSDAAGDVVGPYKNLTVQKIQNQFISTTKPTESQVLTYKSGVWTPSNSSEYTHFIGEKFNGGIIFYLFKEKGIEKGLIMSLKNVGSDESIWSTVNNSTGITVGSAEMTTWDGETNTKSIINQQGHTKSAAKQARDSTQVGVSGWYLPSVDEFILINNSRYIINKVLDTDMDNNTESLGIGRYWTSTGSVPNSAIAFDFATNTSYAPTKSTPLRVRSIRKF